MTSMKKDDWRHAPVRYAAIVKFDPRLRKLSEADWDSISAILYDRTKAKLKSTRFRGERGGHVPGGHEAGDFSQEAITVSSAELLEWDGEQPSLLECLWKIILRHIKRYSARDENTKEQLSTTNPAEANSHVADVSNLRQTCYPEPEDNLSEEETIELILKKFRRHRDFKFIEIILREDVETPQEIAEKLGIKVKEVNNAQKRLRRNPYLLSLLRQRGGGNSS